MATKYRIRGQIYEANSKEEAYAMAERAERADTGYPVDWKEVGKGNVREVGNFLGGMKTEASRLGRNAVNLMLPKSMEPSWSTDDAIKQYEKENQVEGMGKLGALTTDVATAVPFGGAEALVAKGAMAALPRAGAFLQGAGRVARAGASGAGQGALLASPGQRGQGAAAGGVLGGALSTVGEGGRVLRYAWDKARISDKARTLLSSLRSVDPEAFIPAAQGLEPGVLKAAYQGWVANMPGIGHKVRRQADEALDAARVKAVENALPEGTILEHVYQVGDDFQHGLELLGKKWDEVFEPVNTTNFTVPKGTLDNEVLTMLRTEKNPAPDMGTYPGKVLTETRTRLQEFMNDPNIVKEGARGAGNRAVLQKNLEKLDALIEAQLPREVFDEWKTNLGRYKAFQDLWQTVGTRAPGNAKFGMQSLADTSSRRAGDAGVIGKGGPQQDLGNLSAEVLEGFPSKPGIFQQVAATAASSGLVDRAQMAAEINKDSPGYRAAVDLGVPFALAAWMGSKGRQQKFLTGGKGTSPYTKALMRWARRSSVPTLYNMMDEETE